MTFEVYRLDNGHSVVGYRNDWACWVWIGGRIDEYGVRRIAY